MTRRRRNEADGPGFQGSRAYPRRFFPTGARLEPAAHAIYPLLGIALPTGLPGIDPAMDPANETDPIAVDALTRISGLTATPRTRRNLLRTYAPALLHKPGLGVLYVGAGFYEIADAGRWHVYDALTQRVPIPRLYAVGPGIEGIAEKCTDVLPASVAALPSPLVSVMPGTAAQNATAIRALLARGEIDVVIFHHPDLLGDDQMLADDTMLRELLRGPAPFLGTSFSPEDYEFAASGFLAQGVRLAQPMVNPAPHHQSYETDHNPDVRWGHVMWRVDATARPTMTERGVAAAQWQRLADITNVHGRQQDPNGFLLIHIGARSFCGRFVVATSRAWLDPVNACFEREDGATLAVPPAMAEAVHREPSRTQRAGALFALMRAADPVFDALALAFPRVDTMDRPHPLPTATPHFFH